MHVRITFLAALLVCLTASAAAVRYDNFAATTNAQCVPGFNCPVLAVPGASVLVYTNAAGTAAATTYNSVGGVTTCPTYAPLTPPNSTACQSTSNSSGGFGFWVAPGTYYVFVSWGGIRRGPYPISIGGTGGGGSGPTLETNGVPNTDQTVYNLTNTAAFNGVTLAFSNPSGGTVTPAFSGTLNNSGLTNSTIGVNVSGCLSGGGTVALGSSITLGSSNCVSYPPTGVPSSTGSAWGSSYTVGASANNLIQLNGSAQLPSVSAALLTNLPITLTTTGSSGAATYTQATNTLNIPQYSGGGGGASSFQQLTDGQASSTSSVLTMAAGGVIADGVSTIYGGTATITKNSGTDTGVFGAGYNSSGQRVCWVDSGSITLGNYTVSSGFNGSACVASIPSGVLVTSKTTITSGVFQTPVDYRAAANIVVVNCGSNLTTSGFGCAVDSTSALTWTGAVDDSGASVTKPFQAGTIASRPAAATAGANAVYLETDGASACDTSTGSGTTYVIVNSNGSSWSAPNCGGSTVVVEKDLSPVSCVSNAGTASTSWWLPASSAPSLTCSGDGVIQYASASNQHAMAHIYVPEGWTSGTVSVQMTVRADATSGTDTFQISTLCPGTTVVPPPTSGFNAGQNVSFTPTSTQFAFNYPTLSSMTMTGCSAGSLLVIDVKRTDSNTGNAYLDQFDVLFTKNLP